MSNGKWVVMRAAVMLLILVVVVGGLVVRHQRAQIAGLRGQVAQLQLDRQNGQVVTRKWAACSDMFYNAPLASMAARQTAGC